MRWAGCAVVCQQQKPLRILVKPADGHNAESPVLVRHKFHDGLCLRIVGGGRIACGLVEHDEDRPAQAHGRPYHGDMDGCFVKFPALVGHDRAVCGYAARADDRAQRLPAGDARLTRSSVTSLCIWLLPVINKIGLHRLYHANQMDRRNRSMVIMTAKVPERRLLLIVLLLIAAAVVLALCLRGAGGETEKPAKTGTQGATNEAAHRLPRELRLAGRAGAASRPSRSPSRLTPARSSCATTSFRSRRATICCNTAARS